MTRRRMRLQTNNIIRPMAGLLIGASVSGVLASSDNATVRAMAPIPVLAGAMPFFGMLEPPRRRKNDY